MSKIKKAVLTGGGRAMRLRPITTTINKHLIPLANKPMIFHAIEKVVKAGIKEIFINTNPGETELQRVVGDGQRWGVKIKFFEQEGGPQGIAHVVSLAEKFIGGEPFLFYLSDNIILADLNEMMKKFAADGCDCMLALAKVPDPERFGVPIFDKNKKLVDVVEKPKNPANNFAVTGIYFYGPKVFFAAFDHIEKSDRGEYEISAIHSHLLKTGQNVGYQEITGWWKDTGKPSDLLAANSLLLDQLPSEFFFNPPPPIRGRIEEGVLPQDNASGNTPPPAPPLEGEGGYKVKIEENVQIKGDVQINGPVIIGKNAVLENCAINPYTVIGRGSVIKRASVENSLIFDNCVIDCPSKIKNSIIGKGAVITQKEGNPSHSLILGDNTVVEM